MPRRYRPPTRRRRSKSRDVERKPAAAAPDGSPAPTAEPAPSPAPPAWPRQAERSSGHVVRHIARDHAYVLAEVRLSALLVAFILGGLIITAILR